MPRPFLPVAVDAHARGIFAIAYSPSTMGSAKSFVLCHDGRLAQPWRRLDMKRDIYGMLADPDQREAGGFLALSNEGDVYTIGPEGMSCFTLPGAGLTERGGTFRLADAGGRVMALGRGNQIWERVGPELWEDLGPDITPPDGYGPPTWTDALALADGTLVIAGNAKVLETPDYLTGAPKPPVLGRALTQAETESYVAEFQAYARVKRAELDARFPLKSLGYIARRLPTGWALAKLEQKGAVFGLWLAADGAIWAVGEAGQILRSGDGAQSFAAVAGDPKIRYAGIAEAHDGMIVLHGRALVRIDAAGAMHPLPIPKTPEAQAKWLAPADYVGLPDGLLYADANHGILFRDRQGWHRIEVPAAILGSAKRAREWIAEAGR